MTNPIPSPVPRPGSLGIPLLRERIRAALNESWRQEQDGEEYQIFRVADYDTLRNAVSDLLEIEGNR